MQTKKFMVDNRIYDIEGISTDEQFL